MGATLDTITVSRRTYLVERVSEIDVGSLPVRFVLHDPRGRTYLGWFPQGSVLIG
jgi:hypothetical protein